MDYCRLEELVTLHFGSFAALSKWAKVLAQGTGCSKQVTECALRWQLFPEEQSKDHPDWSVTHCQEWGLFLLGHLFHNAVVMRKREMQQHLQRHPHSHQSKMAKKMAPVHPSVRSLLGSADEEMLKLAKDVYHGWYQVVPSVIPHQCQDQLMGDLHRESGQQMMRGGLCVNTGLDQSLSRGRVCSWACSQSQTWSPLAETSRKEGTSTPWQHGCNCTWAKWSPSTDSARNKECPHTSSSDEGCCEATHAEWPRGDSTVRCSQSRCRHSLHPSRSQWYWSLSPGNQLQSKACPQSCRCVSSSLSPLCSQHEDEQLHHSFSNLDLQPQCQESQNRDIRMMWPRIAQMRTAEWSTVKSLLQGPAQKQVWFNLVDNLDEALELPANLAGFLEWLECAADEQNNAQHPLPPQPWALQCHQWDRVPGRIPPLLEEPNPRPTPPHWPGPWLPVGPRPDIMSHQTW